jgi:hypothetical protein
LHRQDVEPVRGEVDGIVLIIAVGGGNGGPERERLTIRDIEDGGLGTDAAQAQQCDSEEGME